VLRGEKLKEETLRKKRTYLREPELPSMIADRSSHRPTSRISQRPVAEGYDPLLRKSDYLAELLAKESHFVEVLDHSDRIYYESLLAWKQRWQKPLGDQMMLLQTAYKALKIDPSEVKLPHVRFYRAHAFFRDFLNGDLNLERARELFGADIRFDESSQIEGRVAELLERLQSDYAQAHEVVRERSDSLRGYRHLYNRSTEKLLWSDQGRLLQDLAGELKTQLQTAIRHESLMRGLEARTGTTLPVLSRDLRSCGDVLGALPDAARN
jgi:hypothetical protein